MSKDLTNSAVDRKNILNNRYAIEAVYQHGGLKGIEFEGKIRLTKVQVASAFLVDVRTIDRLLEGNKQELLDSGYELFTGNKLREFKSVVKGMIDHAYAHDIDVASIAEEFDNEWDSLSRISQLGVFTFKSYLNVGMLLTTSDRAKEMRSVILDMVLDVLNKRMGGTTKFINQREEEFLPSAIREFNYRQEFTNAIYLCVAKNTFKYSQLTDAVYRAIFKENAKEYKQILKLHAKDSVRDTLYTEVLDLIASYENGYSDRLKKRFTENGKALRLSEALALFKEFDSSMEAFVKPLREKARSLMASRDMAFRDALHEKLQDYVSAVSSEDFEKFLGERSKTLDERLEENKEVFKRLKDR
jgi:hypothetical protein